MANKPEMKRLETGIRNLDEILGGGLPRGSVTVIAGHPGAGKTIFTQQMCFHNASARTVVLSFNTLSEPTAKTLLHLKPFAFFDAKKLKSGIEFVDLGMIARTDGLEVAAALIMQHVERVKPAIVVIDSFKVFDDISASQGQLRRFSYELAVNLMAWECTTFLIGEYSSDEFQTNPLFSVVDGLITFSQQKNCGEQQRYFQVVKMRGTSHSRDEYPFAITESGIEVFAPRLTIKRRTADSKVTERLQTGIDRLDDLLGEGIPLGSSFLIGGVAGTGKTVLSLEFIYRGALAGEKGIIFSFEETAERLRASARGLGWDFDRQVERGMIEIVFIPQPNIEVERDLLMMYDRMAEFDAKRVAIDSISVFLHKVIDPQIAREKVFQLSTIVQNAGAVGFFATDIPYGAETISRFGVEETVTDGVIVLSSTKEGPERQRYIEVYKLRNTAHLKGQHAMTIGPGGVAIFPRYSDEEGSDGPPLPVGEPRVSTGCADLDALFGGGLHERSVTLITGSAGIGKTTLAIQFILEAARRKEPALYVTLEEGPAQVAESAESLGLPLKAAMKSGLVEVTYLDRTHSRANQLLSILSDAIERRKVRRIVVDSVSHIEGQGLTPLELRELVYNLAVRFKALGATSMLTLESASMLSLDPVTGRGLSPIADNLVGLRYRRSQQGLERTLTVVKARASSHDMRTHRFTIGKGGLSLGDALDLAGGER